MKGLSHNADRKPDLVFTTAKKDRTGSDVGEVLRFEIDGEMYAATKNDGGQGMARSTD